jgi:phosphoenolpyruvate synthase/pyruvate phosphate dikinase
MSGEKYVYFFGGGEAEGNTTMKEILGGKGANLAEMSNIGLNVPPGFTCTTTACKAYQAEEKLPDGAPPSTSRRWSSATPARLRFRRRLHPRTRPTARTSSTVSS